VTQIRTFGVFHKKSLIR